VRTGSLGAGQESSYEYLGYLNAWAWAAEARCKHTDKDHLLQLAPAAATQATPELYFTEGILSLTVGLTNKEEGQVKTEPLHSLVDENALGAWALSVAKCLNIVLDEANCLIF
jgi:hypothetical protein